MHTEPRTDSGDVLRAIIEAAPVAIIGLDLDGNVCNVWNPAAEKMLGWRAAEVMGRPLPTVPSESQEEFAHFRETIRRGLTLDGVNVHRQRRDGSPIDYAIYASPLHDADGRITGNIAVLVDIGDRIRAETELHRREEAFRALAENSPDFIARHDLEGRIVYCNPALVNMLGIPQTEILDQNPADLAPGAESTRLFQNTLEEVARSGRPAELEFTLDAFVAAPLPTHHVRFVPEFDRDGRVASVLTVGRDVSRLKEAERGLRTLVDNLPDMIARFDTSGRFTFISPNALEAYGLPAGHFLGKTLLDVAAPEDRQTSSRLLDAISRVVAEGIPNRHEVDGHMPQGQRYFEIRYIPEFDTDAGVGSVLGIARDITEQRQAAEEHLAHLQYFANMDKVNRAIQGVGDLDQMMSDVLETLLSIFDCDRAWLVYPCDPDAATWRVPMERTRPEYPGAFARGHDIPTYPSVAETMRAVLDSDEPVNFGPGAALDVPAEVTRDYGVRAYIAMAIHPKIGKPWIFGLHQCSRPRVWTKEEARLFSEIGRRLSDALTSLLVSRSMQESDERFRQIAENIQEVFWLTDVAKNKMLYVNPAYEVVWGRSCDSLYVNPMQWYEAIHPEDRGHFEGDWVDRQVRGEYDVEYRIVRPDGATRYIRDRAFPIRGTSGTVYRIAGIAQDITAQKERDARIQYLAYHDALTGLPNRILVMNRLEQAIAQAQRRDELLAVLFFDLDRFKTINDTLGHPAGDTLLQQVGRYFDVALREGDTVGRVGGDEFLIILQGLNTPEDAAHVTGKILESLATPFTVAGHELHVSASIGISLYPRDADDAETLVKYADTALFLAKEQGRNTLRFFSPELDTKVRVRLHMENDLRSAIARQEMVLHYQPLIDLTTGKVTGAEALIRWQHPLHGLVSPLDFIPIAEETGLIIPIGEWVLRTASAQACAWQALGIPDFRISVNLSRRQLEQPDLSAVIRRILEETGCEPSLLELEITESSVMNEPVQAVEKLVALHDMGLTLALDDFGTGYSSLAYLKRFPLDRLKIDKSFVAGIPQDNDDVAIVHTTIVLARQLRLKVIAEGVETEAQRAFLTGIGCDEMQGYLSGKPMLPDDIGKCWGFSK